MHDPLEAALGEALRRNTLYSPHCDLIFERGDLLGRGGMGAVFKVRDRRFAREAALKVVRNLEAPPSVLARFRREAKIMARLDHPNIPPLFDHGETPRAETYILMPLLRGRNLRERCRDLHAPGARKKDAERRRLLEVLVKVADAMAYAHSRGIIHRDLKASNIMVGDRGEVSVIDWGLARDLDESEDAEDQTMTMLRESLSGLTREGAVLGTPGYMAPEQADGRTANEAADIYALGAILVEVLTGLPPVTGASSIEILQATIKGEVAMPRSRDATIDPRLDELARRALDTNPSKRLKSAQAFGRELREALRSRTRPRKRRSPALALLLIGLILGLGSGALWSPRAALAPAPPVVAERPAPQAPREMEDRVRRAEARSARLSAELERLKRKTGATSGPLERAVAELTRALDPELALNPAEEATSLIAALDAVRGRFADQAPFRLFCGRVLLSEELLERALSDLEAAVRLEDGAKDAECWSALGECQAELGRFEQALASYEKAIALEPENLLLIQMRGGMKARLRRYPEAEQDLSRAIDAGSETHDGEGHFFRALCALAVSEFEAAESELQSALGEGYEEAEALRALERLLTLLGRAPETASLQAGLAALELDEEELRAIDRELDRHFPR